WCGSTADRPGRCLRRSTPGWPSLSTAAGRCSCPTIGARRGGAGGTPRPSRAGGESWTWPTRRRGCGRRPNRGGPTRGAWFRSAARRGGFTVLLLLALHPELCAAGVDLYGVADLLELDETTHRLEAHYLHGVVGPLPDSVDRYRQRSPVNLADRIRAPLLILQGSSDKVVPPAQSEAVANAVRAQGGVVEHHVYE